MGERTLRVVMVLRRKGVSPTKRPLHWNGLSVVSAGIPARLGAVKKLIALILALASGVYLAFGWLPDPIPFVDEGVALVVFLNSLAHLGLDLRRFFGMGGGKKVDKGEPIDID